MSKLSSRIWWLIGQFCSAWLSLVMLSDDSDEELIKRIAHHEPFTDFRQAIGFTTIGMFFLLRSERQAHQQEKTWEENVQSTFLTTVGWPAANFKRRIMFQKDSDACARLFLQIGWPQHQNGLLTTSPPWLLRVRSIAVWLRCSNGLITWINGGNSRVSKSSHLLM